MHPFAVIVGTTKGHKSTNAQVYKFCSLKCAFNEGNDYTFQQCPAQSVYLLNIC